MQCSINDVDLHYVQHGTGTPLIALHGAGVDHRDIEAAVETIIPATGYRRIYPDLPGMGRTTAAGLTCNDDVVDLLGAFIDHLDTGPVLLLGHSYGAYLARGLAGRRAGQVAGLALICPVGEQSQALPEHRAVREDADAYAELDPELRADFDGYFVVRTAATARRYRDHVAPGTKLVDKAALSRILGGWPIDVGQSTCSDPALIVAGRNDAVAGYRGPMELLERYPHATAAVIEGAGHAVLHERPGLLTALVGDWLERC